jgi:hypothetical protein
MRICTVFSRRAFLSAICVLALVGAAERAAFAQADPLQSWNDGPAKTNILDFVRKVTKEGSADFVAPAERFAVFDNDGTLWAEQPIYFQLAFAFDEIKRLAPQHPDWRDQEPQNVREKGDSGIAG